MRCDLCDTIWDYNGYGRTTCPKCGQVYSYDEGLFPELNEEQLNALKNLQLPNENHASLLLLLSRAEK